MVEKFIAWEFVKDAPYILVPRSHVFVGLDKPLVRVGKHFRDVLEDFQSVVSIENRRNEAGKINAYVTYLARYIPVK